MKAKQIIEHTTALRVKAPEIKTPLIELLFENGASVHIPVLSL